jgi:2-polyprenyl-6-methoxyphenol hydroxylase-like FAD-dependent oxidoreductase
MVPAQDVVIIGGGVADATLAAMLVREDIQVTVLERDLTPVTVRSTGRGSRRRRPR